MTPLVKVDGQAITADDFIRTLKLNGQYDALIEQIVRDRITAQTARKAGIQVTEQDIQERANQFRRARGLHRAADTNKYLDALHVSLDEFEAFLADSLYQERMLQQVCSEQAVASYFKLNSPRFDGIEVSHMLLDAEGKAREMISVLADDPGCFEEMAREHSIGPTREQGGRLGKVLRGALRSDVEAKVFNAAVGEVLGPFASADRSVFEIFRVDARHPAQLDEATRTEVQRVLREGWLRARAQEHQIEAC